MSDNKILKARVKVWSTYDPENSSDVKKLQKKIDENEKTKGWKVHPSFDFKTREAFIIKIPETMLVRQSSMESVLEVDLPQIFRKPSEGEKASAQLEKDYDGYTMTEFDPFLGKARLAKLSPDEIRCRNAVANALGCKNWQVKCKQKKFDNGVGFECKLPGTYQGSKHDKKLQEVAESVIGKFGWFAKTDAKALICQIVPDTPATFPKVIPVDDKYYKAQDPHETEFGYKLPSHACDGYTPISIPWKNGIGVLIAGLAGAGKGNLLSDRVITPRGYKTVGDLKVGDLLYNHEGEEVLISEVMPVDCTKMYKVSFSTGQTITVSPDHLWSVSTAVSRNKSQHKKRRVLRDAAFEKKISLLKDLAKQACYDGLGATTGQIANMFNISKQTVLKVANEYKTPFLLTNTQHDKNSQLGRALGVPKMTHTKVYVADEWIEHYICSLGTSRGYKIANGTKPQLRIISTKEMLEKLDYHGHKNYAVPVSKIEGRKTDLPIDPYWFGAWLGDGSSWRPEITVGKKDYSELKEQLVSSIGFVKTIVTQNNGNYVLRFQDNLQSQDKFRLTDKLKSLGVLQNKHIPIIYLRSSIKQRLELLQGIMDTDGTIDSKGKCELGSSNKLFAYNCLELIRSLGIKASLTEKNNAGYKNQLGEFIKCKTHYRIHFTTAEQVFKLSRHVKRLPKRVKYDKWIYIVSVEETKPQKWRCIRTNDVEHTYQMEGNIPTHNSVTINCILAHQLSFGAEVAILDDPNKSVDFEWCKDMIHENWWGCNSTTDALAVLSMVAEEGDRRAGILKRSNVQNWFELEEKYPDEAFKPILVVMDESQMMLQPPKKLAGLPKDHPARLANEQEIAEKSLLYQKLSQVLAKYRFVGVRVIVATQVASQAAGLGTDIRSKLGFKFMLGTNPSKSQMNLTFSVPDAIQRIPQNLKEDKSASRGAGYFEIEGGGNGIFKSAFASAEDLRKTLIKNYKQNLTKCSNPEPTNKQRAQYGVNLEG
jgi:replicative DNA helicase